MKTLLGFSLLILLMANSTLEKGINSPTSLQLLATVTQTHGEYLTIQVDNVVGYGQELKVIPTEGDEITVRLPGGESPPDDSKIRVELKESISLGENPTAYILVGYTILFN